MTDPERLQVLRRALISRRGGHTGPAAPTPECLPEETIAALAEGDTARDLELQHLADCADCRRAVASVAAALADRAVARAITAGGPPRFGRLLGWAVPLTAAAALLVLLGSPDPGPSGHRASVSAGALPVPIQPVGPVAEVARLIWTRVADADRYRVTLFDARGSVIFEAQSDDTMLTLPDSVRLLRDHAYLWKVDARTGWDRWTASDLVEFSLPQGPPR